MLLQGDYDQSKTKVLHLSANPASEARQCLRQDQARLQEECERLRKLVSTLERGGPVPADLETSCLPSSKEMTGRTLPVLDGPWGCSGVCLSVHLPNQCRQLGHRGRRGGGWQQDWWPGLQSSRG